MTKEFMPKNWPTSVDLKWWTKESIDEWRKNFPFSVVITSMIHNLCTIQQNPANSKGRARDEYKMFLTLFCKTDRKKKVLSFLESCVLQVISLLFVNLRWIIDWTRTSCHMDKVGKYSFFNVNFPFHQWILQHYFIGVAILYVLTYHQ